MLLEELARYPTEENEELFQEVLAQHSLYRQLMSVFDLETPTPFARGEAKQ